MEFKKLFRSTDRDLQRQINRCIDQMDTYEVDTAGYSDCIKQYVQLLQAQKDREELRNALVKAGLTATASVGGILLYRKLFDTSADPLFRDFGRQILSAIKHS